MARKRRSKNSKAKKGIDHKPTHPGRMLNEFSRDALAYEAAWLQEMRDQQNRRQKRSDALLAELKAAREAAKS